MAARAVYSHQSKTFILTSGNELLSACVDDDFAYQNACPSYIDGVIAGYELATNGLASTPVGAKLCVPAGVTRGQIYDVVLHNLKEHPEVRHSPSEALIINSLLDPWTCKR
jgi:hypothetical protein